MKKLLQPLFKIFESHSAIRIALLAKPPGIFRAITLRTSSGSLQPLNGLDILVMMDVDKIIIQLNMTPEETQNETNIEGHLMTPGWRIFWNTFFGGSMFLSILGNLTIIFMMWGESFFLLLSGFFPFFHFYYLCT